MAVWKGLQMGAVMFLRFASSALLAGCFARRACSSASDGLHLCCAVGTTGRSIVLEPVVAALLDLRLLFRAASSALLAVLFMTD